MQGPETRPSLLVRLPDEFDAVRRAATLLQTDAGVSWSSRPEYDLPDVIGVVRMAQFAEESCRSNRINANVAKFP